MNLDPRIGVLNSGKFYAFADGYDQPEFVGTLEEVAMRLGLHQARPLACRSNVKRVLLDFAVTVTPAVVTFAGGGYEGSGSVFGEYTVQVTARNRSEAISQARRARYQEDGRYGVKAIYRARRV